MVSESEARNILREVRIERDVCETRSCLQIATDLGLIVLTEVLQINEELGQDTA